MPPSISEDNAIIREDMEQTCDFWSTVLSTLTPIVVMICTFIFQNRKHKKDMASQQGQFAKQLDIEKNNHQRIFEQSEEYNRIAIMPYFEMSRELLVESIPTFFEKSFLAFSPAIENVGNGAAVEMGIVEHMGSHGKCVYEEDSPDITKIYWNHENIRDTITKVGDKTEFVLGLRVIDKNTNKETGYDDEGEQSFSEVYFSIRFRDLKLNLYEQCFEFTYRTPSDKTIGVNAIEVKSMAPKLIR